MAMLPVQAPSQSGPIHQIRPRLTGTSHRGLAGHSDERLVAIAKEGDERAFEVLYERHSPAILRYCRSLLRSTQEAEDVKQEVFVLAISALRRGAQPDAFRPWLYRVAHNACMSHLRVRRPVLIADNGVLVGPATAAEPVDGHREELRQLLDDIGQLPDVQRGALLLREMDGFSYEQVGEVLGLPLSTVRASIFRARRTLQGLADARDADCEEIQSELSRLADRRGRRGRHITTHLHVCSICRDFRDGLRRRPAVLGGVVPVAPLGPGGLLLALKGKLLGGATAGGAGAALATGGGSASVAKFAVVAASSIALLAGAGIEADHAVRHSHRQAAAGPRVVSVAPAARTTARASAGAATPATAAAAPGLAGADAALRAAAPAHARPATGHASPGARARTRAKAPSGAGTTTRGHGAPRATVPAAATAPAEAAAPAAGEREHAGSGRTDERGAAHSGGRHRGAGRGDDEHGGGSGSPGGATGATGSGHERAEETPDQPAPHPAAGGDDGGGSSSGGADHTPAPAPGHTGGSGPSAPTAAAPAPAPAPQTGAGTPAAPTTPASPPPATPPPPADPTPPADPPADPPVGDTTVGPAAVPSDPAAGAVVPAP